MLVVSSPLRFFRTERGQKNVPKFILMAPKARRLSTRGQATGVSKRPSWVLFSALTIPELSTALTALQLLLIHSDHVAVRGERH